MTAESPTGKVAIPALNTLAHTAKQSKKRNSILGKDKQSKTHILAIHSHNNSQDGNNGGSASA